jgi:hypothetical protein
MEDRREDRSLGSLFSDLTNQMATLVRQELDLARTEVSVKATAVTRDAAMIGIGGALLYAALLAALVMVGLLLVDLGLEPWLSALIVAIAGGVLGGALVMRGRSHLAEQDLAPKRTVETIKDDAAWAKERMP